jgi:gluconolactonase
MPAVRRTAIGFVAAFIGLVTACDTDQAMESPVEANAESVGTILRLDSALNVLVPIDATIEKVAGGFEFIEGPVWMPGPQGRLLFSDIPANTVYSWSEDSGLQVLLNPVKHDDSDIGGVGGSNGLALDAEGRLILCEHGNRRVARMEADGSRTTLADRYDGKRLNSPNDIVFHSSGAAFFTDPPYGLEEQDADPAKEQSHNGIYRLDADGKVTLLATGQSRPNGIGLSPDEHTVYVANSDWPASPLWMSYPVLGDLTLGDATVLFDASGMTSDTYNGTPDGLTLDRTGNIYATGPGGVLIFNAQGKHLGTIELNEVAANVGWGDDGKTLYITASTSLYRIKLTADGLVFRKD